MTATCCPDATPALTAAEPFAIGAHLVTPRRGYSHHGIYIGGQRVVHYAGWSRATFGCRPVEEISLAQFAGPRGVRACGDTPVRYAPDEIVARARSRLGEDSYRLASNNCEHFCHWCLSGEHRSAQAERMLGWLRGSARACQRWVGSLMGNAPRLRTGRC